EQHLEDNGRSISVDRTLFGSADKRAHAQVGLTNANVPGNIQGPRHSRSMRSVDLGRGKYPHTTTPSPLSSSPKTTAAYQHGQPNSDPNFGTRQHLRLDERPQTAHRPENAASSRQTEYRVSSSPDK